MIKRAKKTGINKSTSYSKLSELLIIGKRIKLKALFKKANRELLRRADLIPTEKLMKDLNYYYTPLKSV